MTLRCWQQDPALRPTVTEVAGLLREWLAFSVSTRPTSQHSPCSYRLRTLNPSLPELASRPPVEGVDAATINTPISQMCTNGKPTPKEPSGTPQQPDQMNLETCEASADLNLVPNPPGEPLSDRPCALSISGNSNGGHPLAIVHNTHAAYTDNHLTIPTPSGCPMESIPEAAAKRIEEIAEVTQLVISPFGSDNSVSGARPWESKIEEKCRQTPEVVWSSLHRPNVIQA